MQVIVLPDDKEILVHHIADPVGVYNIFFRNVPVHLIRFFYPVFDQRRSHKLQQERCGRYYTYYHNPGQAHLAAQRTESVEHGYRQADRNTCLVKKTEPQVPGYGTSRPGDLPSYISARHFPETPAQDISHGKEKNTAFRQYPGIKTRAYQDKKKDENRGTEFLYIVEHPLFFRRL